MLKKKDKKTCQKLINFSQDELKLIKKLILKYKAKNFSEWVRTAAKEWRPQK